MNHGKNSACATMAILFAITLANADWVTDTIATGTNPRAVAVNPVTNTMYVANFGSATVTVISGAFSQITATITVGSSPCAVAVNPLTNKIYVANQAGGSVTVIDGATNLTNPVVVGTTPYAVAVNPATNLIYVANYGSNTVTRIDGATNITQSIAVGSSPCAIAVNPVTNKIYAANVAGSTVTVIDGATNLTNTVTVGGSPYAVTVNTVTNTVYVANAGSGTVSVIDGASETVTTSVTAGTMPFAIAVNPSTNRIYVANNGSSNVTVIDGATNTPTAVTAGTSPYAIAVNPTMNKIYVANNGSNNVTVIDGATNGTSTVPAGTSPCAIAVNPMTDKIFVNNNGSGNVTVIDGGTNAFIPITISYPGPGLSKLFPCAIAANPVTNIIYICLAQMDKNDFVVVDGASNGIITSFRLGVWTNHGVAVNPVTNKIYVGGGSVTVIDGPTNAMSTVPASGSGPIVVNPVTNIIYVVNNGSNYVSVIYGATNRTATVPVASAPRAIAVNPVTDKIYVANGSTLTMIDGPTNQTTTIAAGSSPYDVAVNPVTNRIYVANYVTSGTVTILDGVTDAIIATVATDTNSCAVAVNSVTNKFYVGNYHNAMIIDGATNIIIARIPAGTMGGIPFESFTITVNPVTNKIYWGNTHCCSETGNIVMIDGATNAAITICTTGSRPFAVVNPVTNKSYVGITYNSIAKINPCVIDETPQSNTYLRAFIDSLPNNATYSARPALTGKAVNRLRPGHTGISSVLQYMNTDQYPFASASITGNAGTDSVRWSWNWGSDSLAWGENFLCFAAIDSQCATTDNQGVGTPFTGNVTVYPIYRIRPPATPPQQPPVLVSPANNALDQPIALTFLWNRVPGANSYGLQVAIDSNFYSLVFNSAGLIDTFQNISGLANSTVYFWRAYALNEGGPSDWSTVWRFRTIDALPPPAPTLSSPADGELNVRANPTPLIWNASTGALTYNIQVSRVSDFATLVLDSSGITATADSVYGLLPITLYYWRVRAANAAGNGAWSQIRSFTISITSVLPASFTVKSFACNTSSHAVTYALPRQCFVSIKYYDLRGRLVASLVNSEQTAGYYTVRPGNAIGANGALILVFEAGSFVKREIVVMAGR